MNLEEAGTPDCPMTRPDQKAREREAVKKLLANKAPWASLDPEDRESPDFHVHFDRLCVGVEVVGLDQQEMEKALSHRISCVDTIRFGRGEKPCVLVPATVPGGSTDISLFQERIALKGELLDGYRASGASEYWLLITINTSERDSFHSTVWREAEYETGFDRVFVLDVDVGSVDELNVEAA